MAKHQFLWLAIETTDTNPEHGVILEVAAALAEDDVGGSLEVVREWQAVTDEPYDEDTLEEAVVERHLDNGLFASPVTARLSAIDAELAGTLIALNGGTPPKDVVLAGLAAAWTRPWIERHMPQLHRCLAYWVLDVGSLNRAAKAWLPGFRSHYVKANRALPKVHASLQAASFWRQAVGL